MPKHPYFKTLSDMYPHKKEGGDFQRIGIDRGTRFVLIAPHAGGIEPGTGKLVKAIAGQDFSYYLFEGLQQRGNIALHIPSTQFDDPLCLTLVQKSEIAITFHGYHGSKENVLVGGLNQRIIERILDVLIEYGFPAERDRTGHAGVNPANICNRCASKRGVQLELSRPLRKTFFRSIDRPGREHPTENFYRFASAIRKVLVSVNLRILSPTERNHHTERSRRAS